MTVMFDQKKQRLHGFWGQRNKFAAMKQGTLGYIQPEISERVLASKWHKTLGLTLEVPKTISEVYEDFYSSSLAFTGPQRLKESKPRQLLGPADDFGTLDWNGELRLATRKAV